MRVLYVARSYGVHDRRFVDAWRAEGAEVRAVAADGTAPGQPHDATLTATVASAVAEHRPDVVHAGPVTDVAPAVAGVWGGPLIATSWGFDLMDEVEHDPAARARAAAVLRRADVVHVDNAATAEVARALGADDGSLVQFPWGIDLSRFGPGPSGLRARLGWDGMTVVLSSRRHEPLYQVDVVVRAFATAALHDPGLRLLLAGSGSGTAELLGLVAEAGLSDRVHAVGELGADDLADAYRAADLYVSTSGVDGSSISLLEAMACGTPVCVTDIPGNRQWVTARTGETFPVGDVAGLADRLRALSDPTTADLRAARVSAAVSLVARDADWNVNRAVLREVAERAIARKGDAA